MESLRLWLQGKKTYFLVSIGVIAVFIKFLSGDMDITEFFMSPEFRELLFLLGIGTVKAGLGRSTPKDIK